MVWIRVTRVMADTAAIHETVLLNTANIVSIEQMQETTYIYLRDGRHFAVTESVETLGLALVPVTMAERFSESAVYIVQDQQEPSAIPSATEYEYASPPQHILVPLDCREHTRHVFD